MRIAIFTETYLPQINGVVTHIKILKEGLEALGHTVLIVTADAKAHRHYIEDGVLHCPAHTLKRIYNMCLASPVSSARLHYLREFNPDIIHLHTEFSVGLSGLAIAKILNISPADLIGYQKPEIQLDSLSDVIAVLYQLNKKAGIRFEIDVQRPPHSEEWSCSLKFKGNDHSAEMNDSLCLILEEFRDEREKLETYWTDPESFDRWIEKELAYYADAKLQDKEVEVLSDLERIQRRNELDRQMLEKMKKAAEENGDQE